MYEGVVAVCFVKACAAGYEIGSARQPQLQTGNIKMRYTY
jgi:hypothetical protein